MSSAGEYIYDRSPIFLQHLLVSLYGYVLKEQRYGKTQNRVFRELLKSQWYNEAETHSLQMDLLSKLLDHAYRNVPYYTELFRRLKIVPSDIKNLSDLQILPVLQKEDVKHNPEMFIATNIDSKSLLRIHTSGSTGTPMKIFVTKEARQINYAFFSRALAWAGVHDDDQSITFGGRVLVPYGQKSPPYWRRNFFMNNTLFSSYHISDATLPCYVAEMAKISPKFIDSYPSSIYAIARHINGKQDKKVIQPRAIITSAETLLDFQREEIESAFTCKVFDQYGAAEQSVFVCQCSEGSYHVNPEYGILELIKNGHSANPGEPAEVICTGFTNYAMPLIRYQIGDTAVLSNEKCSCDRSLPVVKEILGRTDDILVVDGKYIGRLDPIFKGIRNSIKEAQVVQEAPDKIVLKVVKDMNYNKNDEIKILMELSKRLGDNVKTEVEYLDCIPRGPNGKFRSVISRVHP